MRSIGLFPIIALLGCSSPEPPAETTRQPAPPAITEADVKRIARAVAKEAIAAAHLEARQQADELASHEAEAAGTAQQAERKAAKLIREETIARLKQRAQTAYALMTANERQRVDEIRALLAKQGLAGFTNRNTDLQWAWHGPGGDVLQLDLMEAIKDLPAAWREAQEMFALDDVGTFEFYVEDTPVRMRRLSIGRRIRDAEQLEGETLRYARTDPLLRPLLVEQLKNEKRDDR